MWIRKQIEIGWGDLLYGLKCAFLKLPTQPDAEKQTLKAWDSPDAVVTLSVRSGFDALLQCVDWEPGSEVLVSSVTIADMPKIVAQHGFVPVAIDLNPEDLAPSLEELAARTTPKTKAILVAHLFGNRIDLTQIEQFAQAHGLMLIEDCAQTFIPSSHGSAAADVSMFSFGPIKSASALGAGVLEIRETRLRKKVQSIQRSYPVQSRFAFGKRVVKYMLIKFASSRFVLQVLHSIARIIGLDFDKRISKMARGFSGPDFFGRIRHQPSAALLSLLARRLSQVTCATQARRIEKGHRLASLLDAKVPVLNVVPSPVTAANSVDSTYWVFAIQVSNPNEVVEELRLRGFDATRRSSLINVSKEDATVAGEILNGIVFLPLSPKYSRHELERLATAVCQVALPVPKRKLVQAAESTQLSSVSN